MTFTVLKEFYAHWSNTLNTSKTSAYWFKLKNVIGRSKQFWIPNVFHMVYNLWTFYSNFSLEIKWKVHWMPRESYSCGSQLLDWHTFFFFSARVTAAVATSGYVANCTMKSDWPDTASLYSCPVTCWRISQLGLSRRTCPDGYHTPLIDLPLSRIVQFICLKEILFKVLMISSTC